MSALETLEILWFNWKCIRHPYAGGAEKYTHEIAKRLAKAGHNVTLITSSYHNASRREFIDGYEILRTGNSFTIYFKAFKMYSKRFRGKVDLIIDEINTLPFFTVKYVKEKVVALIHQLARKIWFLETPYPISILGYMLEPRYLRLYRYTPTITVSLSTAIDLKKLGFTKIYLTTPGLDIEPLEEIPNKAKYPTVIFLGRLKKAKGCEHIIRAFKNVVTKIPNAKLWIVGEGPLYKKLRKLVYDLKLSWVTRFFGRVPEKKKILLLKKAHVLVLPSMREGWGLVVNEAYSQATPVVAYNVPGVRDSVRHLKTGILVPYGNISELSKALIKILSNRALWTLFAKNALNFAKKLNWDVTYKGFLSALKGAFDE